MSNPNDFLIENGVLTKYQGEGGDVVIPEGVTSVGESAFYIFGRNSTLTSVVIPKGVTSIGNSAFRWCSSLTSVTISEGVTSIGDGAFFGCSGLTSVTIPASVTSIGESAFSGCKNLTILSFKNRSIRMDRWKQYLYQAFAVLDDAEDIDNLLEDLTTVQEYKTANKRFESIYGADAPESEEANAQQARSGYRRRRWNPQRMCEHLSGIHDEAAIAEELRRLFRASLLQKMENRFVIMKLLHSRFTYWEIVGLTGCSSSTVSRANRSLNFGSGGADKAFERVPFELEGILKIGASAFENCPNLQQVSFPEGLSYLGSAAFSGCDSLSWVEFPQTLCLIGKRVFGYSVPERLLLCMDEIYPVLDNESLLEEVLTAPIWESMSDQLKAEIYMSRQAPEVVEAYADLLTGHSVEVVGNAVLKRLNASEKAKDCEIAANYMRWFSSRTSAPLLKKLYLALKNKKSGAAAIEGVENDPILCDRIGIENSSLESAVNRTVIRFLKKEKRSVRWLSSSIERNYRIRQSDLPDVSDRAGKSIAWFVMAWLMIAHIGYDKPGLLPDAVKVVPLLDPESLQQALRKLASEYLENEISWFSPSGYIMKMNSDLADPICRYADEETMEYLTKGARKWKAVSRQAFDEACCCSETNAALLYAGKHSMWRYARLRGLDIESMEDRLADVGLDRNLTKTYDLGNQTVTVRLQSNMRFEIDLPDGRTARTLPKRNSDPEKYGNASKDFSKIRKQVRIVFKNRAKQMFEDFLSERTRTSQSWQTSYLNNPFLYYIAGMIVWAQGENTFTLGAEGPIDSAGQPYSFTDEPIRVAHPMEMAADDLAVWQKYFAANGLKQPFEQIWEPVRRPEEIAPERYKGCMIPYYRLNNQTKHGIQVWDEDFHNIITIAFADCNANVERIDWARHDIAPGTRFEIKEFSVREHTRRANHIVAYLDRIAAWDRVRRDDVTVAALLDGFTLAQITEFLSAAQEAEAAKVTALLLEYKNEHYPDFDPMAEFTLEW